MRTDGKGEERRRQREGGREGKKKLQSYFESQGDLISGEKV